VISNCICASFCRLVQYGVAIQVHHFLLPPGKLNWRAKEKLTVVWWFGQEARMFAIEIQDLNNVRTGREVNGSTPREQQDTERGSPPHKAILQLCAIWESRLL
jgi:hypothetical protein